MCFVRDIVMPKAQTIVIIINKKALHIVSKPLKIEKFRTWKDIYELI